MAALRQHEELGEALGSLVAALERLELGPDAGALAADRDRLAGSIQSYLIPRTTDPATPSMVVLAGPTGSGKSTIMNSLSGLDISKTGALRPTTRAPVVLCRTGRAADYRRIGGVACEVVSGDARILDDIVLVDAPDLDSTSTEHRALAEALIDNADVVVFVTSALRYADDVPWQVLRRAVSRGTPVINVLNRVQSASAGAIVDFRSRLRGAGLEDELLTVPEHHLPDGAQKVPSQSVRALRKRVGEIVSNRDEFSGEVFDRVLRSTIDQVAALVHRLTAAGDDVAALETRMKAHLDDRVNRLDLEGIGEGTCPPHPDERSRRAVRRWWRTMRKMDEETVESLESKLVERILSLVHADLRHWVVEDELDLRDRNVDPVRVVPAVMEEARAQLEGWVHFVGRIAEDHATAGAGWNELVLLEASTFTEAIPVTAMTLGDHGSELVDRARRELMGRLHAVYDHAAARAVSSVGRRQGRLDDDLRASLDAVTSVLAPTYA